MSDRSGRPRGPGGRPGPVVRRDAEGGIAIGPSWEPLVERLIREAQERGELTDLPLHGRPIRVAPDPYAGEMALAWHLLRNAGAAPPWIEADKEVRRLRDAIRDLLRRAERAPSGAATRLGRELGSLVTDHDAAVARLNAEAPVATLHRRPLGAARAEAILAAVLAGEPAPEPFPSPQGEIP